MSQSRPFIRLFFAVAIVFSTAPGLSAQGGKRALKNKQRGSSSQPGKSAVKSRVIDYSGKSTTRYQQENASIHSATTAQPSRSSNADAFSVKAWKPAVQAFPTYVAPNYREQQANLSTTNSTTHTSTTSPARHVPETSAPVVEKVPDAPTYTRQRITVAPSPMEAATIAAKREKEITRKRELEKLTTALAQGESFSVPTPGSPSEVNGAMPVADRAPDQTPFGVSGPALTGNPGVLQATAISPKNEGRTVGAIVNFEDEEEGEESGNEITGQNETPCVTVNSGSSGFGGSGSLGIPYSDTVVAQMPSTMSYCIAGVEAGDDYAVDEMEAIVMQLRRLEQRDDWTIPGTYQALQNKLTRARELYNIIYTRYRDRGYLHWVNHFQEILDSLDPLTGEYLPGKAPKRGKLMRQY